MSRQICPNCGAADCPHVGPDAWLCPRCGHRFGLLVALEAQEFWTAVRVVMERELA